LFNLQPEKKTLVLGTSLWGWGISRHDAYALLEKFFENGGTIVDSATNYPINDRKEDFGLAIKWIADWVAMNEGSGLSLIVKVGSVDNTGRSYVDLGANNLLRSANNLKEQFGATLSCISIHWDNRKNKRKQLDQINQTVRTLSELVDGGLAIGMSGIERPELYYKANVGLAEKWIIQVKENLITRLAREKYQEFFPKAKYLAYGVNFGGLKTEPQQQNSSINLRGIIVPQPLIGKLSAFLESDHSFEPKPCSLNELALANSYVNPALSGVIIGPRSVEQLMQTLKYWKKLELNANKDKGLELFTKLAGEIV
jgi:aryl-alcohol dehydrogenase-like predicted oxidoreductase